MFVAKRIKKLFSCHAVGKEKIISARSKQKKQQDFNVDWHICKNWYEK